MIAALSRVHAATDPDICPCLAGGSFHSAKNDRVLTGTARQLLLFLMLETEPNVTAFEPCDDGAVEVRHWTGMIRAIVLPASGGDREEALRVKRIHVDAGRRTVMIPEKRLQRWPCRENRKLVAEAGLQTIPITERAAIVDSLLESGGSAMLGDLMPLVRSADPAASVLSLVSRCVLRADLNSRPIDGRTEISLFDLVAFGD